MAHRGPVKIGAAGRDEAVTPAQVEVDLRLTGRMLRVVALDTEQARIDEPRDQGVALGEPGMREHGNPRARRMTAIASSGVSARRGALAGPPFRR